MRKGRHFAYKAGPDMLTNTGIEQVPTSGKEVTNSKIEVEAKADGLLLLVRRFIIAEDS